MKKIIDKKRYDTDTATEIHHWSNGLGSSDFHFCWETLYKTPKGNWFLVGKGGSLSKYAVHCGPRSTCGGSELRPLEPDAACQWLEQHGGTEAVEEHFPTEIQDA